MSWWEWCLHGAAWGTMIGFIVGHRTGKRDGICELNHQIIMDLYGRGRNRDLEKYEMKKEA